jgi:hypothetical protein
MFPAKAEILGREDRLDDFLDEFLDADALADDALKDQPVPERGYLGDYARRV